MALDDYGSLIQSGMNLVPDVNRQLALQAQTASLQAEAAANRLKVTRAQQFQQDIHTFDGSPTSTSRLIMKYPEFADHLKQAYSIQDEQKKQADLLTMGQIYSAANSGNWKLAKQLAHTRADAEKAAGHSDPSYDATLNVLDAAADGDLTQQKVVRNMLGMSIAAITGPDKFTETYGGLTKDKGYTLAPGDARFDENNQKVAGVDAKPDFLVVPEGGRAIPLNSAATAVGTGGGGPASPGAAPPAAPGAVVGRTHGYTPRQRDGGDNPDHVVDSKITALSSAVGVDPDAPMNPHQFAAFVSALPTTEGGPGTLSGKQNNPGAIKDGAFAKAQPGYTGAKNGYAVFKDQQSGAAAMQKLLTNRFYNRGQQSIRDIIEGRPAGGVSSAASPVAGGTSPVAQPGDIPGTIYGNPKPQARTLTAAEAKAHGLDPAKVYEQRPDGTVSAVGDADASDVLKQYGIADNMTGSDVLVRLPANVSSQVKALADGRLPMPSSFALAKPYWQHLLQITAQYDPTFDAANAPARKAAILSFTGTGKGAMVVGSVNRVANHLDLLWNESNKLAGPDLKWGPLNTVAAAAGQSFQPADAAAYDGEVTFVSGELGKIAKAGLATQGEVDRIISNLGRKQSLKTRQSAIQAAVGIISGAIDPLKDQYNSAFTNDSTRPHIPWVTPKAQEIYSKIGGVDMSLTGQSADTNAPAANASRQPPAGATKTATGPNGQKAALVNGHWVQY